MSGLRGKILVKCASGSSPECLEQYSTSFRNYEEVSSRHNGAMVCHRCRREEQGGIDNVFKVIDDEYKAYILGLVAGGRSVLGDNYLELKIHESQFNESLLAEVLVEYFNIGGKTTYEYLGEGYHYVRTYKIHSSEIPKDIRNLLRPGKYSVGYEKYKTVQMPDMNSDFLSWCFVRGVFETLGYIRQSPLGVEVVLTGSNYELVKKIIDFVNIPGTYSDSFGTEYKWSGVNALDFLGNIYEDSNIHHLSKAESYFELMESGSFYEHPFLIPYVNDEHWVHCIGECQRTENCESVNILKWAKTDPRAVAPFKERVSDSGYDLTLIGKVKTGIYADLYTTGINVTPPPGYYFDLVPRSSIYKTGYMLANSVGIIDRSYTGTIMVPLVRLPGAPDLEFPCRMVQLVPRKIVNFRLEEVPSLDSTVRGASGFGSSGVK